MSKGRTLIRLIGKGVLLVGGGGAVQQYAESCRFVSHAG